MMSDSPNSDRTHILLEDIGAKLELVVEGQTQLRSDLISEIITRHDSLQGQIQDLQLAVKHNARGIKANGEAIQANTRAIEGNTLAIQGNAVAIQGNGREIQGLHGKFDRLADVVARHDREIRELKAH